MKPVEIIKNCVIFGKPYKKGKAEVTQKEYHKGLQSGLLKDYVKKDAVNPE